MKNEVKKHIKSFHCDHGTTCHSCKAEITPTTIMYMEGKKELCGECGAKVQAAWTKYYNAEMII